MRRLFLVFSLMLVLVVQSCGGGGGSSSGGSSTSGDLKGALNQRIYPALIQTAILKHQDASFISGATVAYEVKKTNIPGFTRATIGVASAQTNNSGAASNALPGDVYNRQLTIPTSAGTTTNYIVSTSSYYDVSLGAAGTKPYKADQYVFKVTAPNTMATVRIRIYATASNGAIDWGSCNYSLKPMSGTYGPDLKTPKVFEKQISVGGLTSQDINVELFEGTYRVVVDATPMTAGQNFSLYVSDPFTVTGTASTSTAQVINLTGTGNSVIVKLQDPTGAPLQGYWVTIKDSTNLLTMSTTSTDSTGQATVIVPTTIPSVIAEVWSKTQSTLMTKYRFTSLAATNNITLQQYNVSGKLAPSVGQLSTTNTTTTQGAVFARLLKTGVPPNCTDTRVASAQTDSLGTFSGLTLFGAQSAALTYTLSDTNTPNYPDVTDTPVSIQNMDVYNVNIPVAPGGKVYGKIVDYQNQFAPNITVFVFRTNADGTVDMIGSNTTNNTGDYTVAVPYGSYFLMTDRGGVTDSVGVSSGSPLYLKNLKYYNLVGSILKDTGVAASGATVVAGFQTATTNNLGTYSVYVMEGKNWICVVPGTIDNSYGYACNMNVLVDANTVAAAGQ